MKRASVVLAAVTALVALVACSPMASTSRDFLASPEESASGPSAEPVTHIVGLKVEFTHYAQGHGPLVTYVNANGNILQEEAGVSSPWSKVLTDVPEGTYVSISAQNSASVGGVLCSVTVDGQIRDSGLSQGGYVICTAHATV
jgi:hypothetical protein